MAPLSLSYARDSEKPANGFLHFLSPMTIAAEQTGALCSGDPMKLPGPYKPDCEAGDPSFRASLPLVLLALGTFLETQAQQDDSGIFFKAN